MQALEAKRKGRRGNYPLRAVWNSVHSGIVFGHESVASLRRQLRRNAELWDLRGLDVFRGARAVPPEWVHTRLLGKLFAHLAALERILDRLVERLRELLPDLGPPNLFPLRSCRTSPARAKPPAQ